MTVAAMPIESAYDRYTDQQLEHYQRVAKSPEGQRLYRRIVRVAQGFLTDDPGEREVFLAYSAAAGIIPTVPETIMVAYETVAEMLNTEAAELRAMGCDECQEPEGLPLLLALGDFLRLHKLAVGLSFYPHRPWSN